VFLAFPSGRLEHRLDRCLVVAGYLTAIGFEFVEMALGGFGPDNLLEVVAEPGAAGVLQQVQLVALCVLCVAGIAALAARRRSDGRPLRRSMAVLIDSFALGLLMNAILLAVGAFNGPGFETIRRIAFVVVGIAPVAFLAGLLSARLARSAVGELVVELRSDPRSVDLRDALARALRDPSLTLAYWLPEFESWADRDGRMVVLPARGRREQPRRSTGTGLPLPRSCTTDRCVTRPSCSKR
jgi:hypothetical protein